MLNVQTETKERDESDVRIVSEYKNKRKTKPDRLKINLKSKIKLTSTSFTRKVLEIWRRPLGEV